MTQFFHVDYDQSSPSDRTAALRNLSGSIVHSHSGPEALCLRQAKWDGGKFVSDEGASVTEVGASEDPYDGVLAALSVFPDENFTFNGRDITAIAVEIL